MQEGHERENAAWTLPWTISWMRNLDTDMLHEYGHGHAAWTCSCSLDLVMQHGLGRAARAAWACSCSMDKGHASWMPECR
jgi:hypothetical protein